MGSLQWCMPLVHGRGAGLGNELVAWARAYLMSQVLDGHCLPPAFGLNARGYHRHFRTSRADFIGHRLMQAALPCRHFGEADYERHGGGDVMSAFARYAQSEGLHERRPLLVTTDGMWGGILHVARAREFVRSALYRTRWAPEQLAALGARLHADKLTVAMHVRLGDFEVSNIEPASYRGRFNCTLPLAWFMAVGRQLQQAFGEQLQFQIFSDGTAAQLAPLQALLKPVDTRSAGPSDIADLLAMSQADLLVCSVSSYSVWAAALSSSPYLWFAPQMHDHGAGWLSIWGHETQQLRAGSPCSAALEAATRLTALNPDGAVGRGHAVDLGGALPSTLLDSLARRALEKGRSGDLVRYGVSRLAAMASR